MIEKVNAPKISKNNLLLVISLSALGYGEQFGLPCLVWFGFWITCFASVLAILTAFKHTYDYLFKKPGVKK